MMMTDILHDIWESEDVPLSWKTSLIVKLPKKGDETNCNNWKGIMLLSDTVPSQIILNRLTMAVDPFFLKSKPGSGKGEVVLTNFFQFAKL